MAAAKNQIPRQRFSVAKHKNCGKSASDRDRIMGILYLAYSPEGGGGAQWAKSGGQAIQLSTTL